MTKQSTSAKRNAWRRWPHRLWRRAACETGATVVEFAMVAPLLFGLLFGVIEFGRAVYTQGALAYAAHEATRWALVNTPPLDGSGNPDYTLYQTQIEQEALKNLVLVSPLKTNPVTAISTPQAQNTRDVTVTMNYTYEVLLPFLKGTVGPFDMSYTSRGFLAEN